MSSKFKFFTTVNGKSFRVHINRLNNFNERRSAKLLLACKELEKVLNSQEFYDEFHNLAFVGRDKHRNAELYSYLMSGASKFGGEDGDMDLDLTFYTKRLSRVIGYGLPNTIRTWVNGKFFDAMSVESLAGHLIHEYMHKLNLDDANGTKSVPYQVGYLVSRLAEIPLTPLSI